MRFRTRLIYTITLTLLLSSQTALARKDNSPPTEPGNLRAESVLDNSIRVAWNASTDNKRVKGYEVFRNGRLVSRTRNLSYVDNDVSPATDYIYQVMATDNFNTSSAARLELTSAETVVVAEPPPPPPAPRENPDPPAVEQPADGDNGADAGNDPVPDTDTGDDPTPSEPTPPTTDSGDSDTTATGAPAGWQVVFNDTFDGSGDLATGAGNNWRFETMEDGLHRAGNSGMNESGSTDVPDWQSVNGKRWSAWYNDFNDANAYRENGALVMGGWMSDRADPTRPVPYDDNGVYTDYGSNKLYTGWLDTWSRKWVGPSDEHVVDPASPAKSFKYGYFEAKINVSSMNTPGFRLSMWLMPASTDAAGQQLVVDTAYDHDGNNGVEIDLFEYEWTGSSTANNLIMGVHGGGAGTDLNIVNAANAGHNLRQGWHTLGLKWTTDEIVWTLNGDVVKRITDSELIPDVYSYLIISREMNSGVKRTGLDNINTDDKLEAPPFRPRDPGLYAENVWEFRQHINTDIALIDYVRVWQP